MASVWYGVRGVTRMGGLAGERNEWGVRGLREKSRASETSGKDELPVARPRLPFCAESSPWLQQRAAPTGPARRDRSQAASECSPRINRGGRTAPSRTQPSTFPSPSLPRSLSVGPHLRREPEGLRPPPWVPSATSPTTRPPTSGATWRRPGCTSPACAAATAPRAPLTPATPRRSPPRCLCAEATPPALAPWCPVSRISTWAR